VIVAGLITNIPPYPLSNQISYPSLDCCFGAKTTITPTAKDDVVVAKIVAMTADMSRL